MEAYCSLSMDVNGVLGLSHFTLTTPVLVQVHHFLM